MKAGLNIFSLRNLIQSKNDFIGVCEKLDAMGYSYLQVSGIPLSPEEINEVRKISGLPVWLTHAPLQRLLEESDKLMAENNVFGCRNIGLGHLTPDIISDENKFRETVAKLNAVAEKMQKEGYTLYLHNHHNEFYKRGKQTAFDYIIENAPAVHFILDTYWVQYGGEDPVGIFERIKGRAECVHLKDYKLVAGDTPMSPFVPKFAPVGGGSLDFPAIVAAAKQAGAQYFFVEQDDACDYPDPLGQVEQSIHYIKQAL